MVILGYPYDILRLTCHVAYVSAVFERGPTTVLQLDGSVNPSNSGGPVVAVESGKVVGYVTRAYTGLLEGFDDLVRAFRENIAALNRPGGARIVIGGLDPHQAFRATMVSMERLAMSMRRSANVGIGYAFSAAPLAELNH